MVVIKTRTFDEDLNRNLHWIGFNRKRPLKQKGSYKVKEWGDIVSDLDFEAQVYYNPGLIGLISRIIKRNLKRESPFFFIHMAVGYYDGYDVPWRIDEEGGCTFDLQRARDWFEESKDLFSLATCKYIRDRLYADKMSLRDLIDIDNAIEPHRQIFWGLSDIQKGFIEHKDKRYFLLDQMKVETPVLEFAYRYKDQYIPVDVGMVDYKFKAGITGRMHRYYTNDWYRIMKGFRWKLPEQYRAEYFLEMKKVEEMIALKYQFGLILKLEQNQVFPQSDLRDLIIACEVALKRHEVTVGTLGEMRSELYDKVNDMLRDVVSRFAGMLPEGHREKIEKYLLRGVEANLGTSEDLLLRRQQIGIRCPFFPTDWVEFEQLTELAQRLDMNVEEVVQCFGRVAVDLAKPVTDIMTEGIAQNGYSLCVGETEVVLWEHHEKRGTYPLTDLNALRIYLLLKQK